MEAIAEQIDREATTQRRPDANALAGLAALRRRVVTPAETVEAAPAPAAQPVVRPTRQSNGELLHAARHGRTASEQNRAAEELRRRVKTLCAAALDRYTGHLTAQEADDLTQDVLVRLLSAASDEGKTPIEVTPAYIQRVAVNHLIDQRRRLDRRGLNKPGLSVDDTEAAIALPDPYARVEDEVVGKFHQYQLRAALDAALSPTEAKVLWLRVGDGLSHAEIADELGIKEANARKHYERGLKRLRTRMETGTVPGMPSPAMFATAAF